MNIKSFYIYGEFNHIKNLKTLRECAAIRHLGEEACGLLPEQITSHKWLMGEANKLGVRIYEHNKKMKANRFFVHPDGGVYSGHHLLLCNIFDKNK